MSEKMGQSNSNNNINNNNNNNNLEEQPVDRLKIINKTGEKMVIMIKMEMVLMKIHLGWL